MSERDRRVHARHRANVVVSISTRDRKDRVGVTSDLSATGLLFHSLSRFSVGERINVVFQTAEVESHAVGHVVRAARDDRWSLFPNVTAIQFETPASEIPEASTLRG